MAESFIQRFLKDKGLLKRSKEVAPQETKDATPQSEIVETEDEHIKELVQKMTNIALTDTPIRPLTPEEATNRHLADDMNPKPVSNFPDVPQSAKGSMSKRPTISGNIAEKPKTQPREGRG
jgi:hypothetical protein